MRRAVASLTAAAALAAFSAIAFLSIAPSGGAAAQSTITIETGNLYFCAPAFQNQVCETTITEGDTIVWDNVAGVHTVTQCDESFSTCPPSGGFDSGTLTQGQTYSRSFASAGTFYYYCAFHPSEMRGRITVQQAATATPTPEPTAEPTPTPEGQTPSPTPEVTATPAGAPGTGGLGPQQFDGASTWTTVALLGGLAAAIAGAGLLLGANRRLR